MALATRIRHSASGQVCSTGSPLLGEDISPGNGLLRVGLEPCLQQRVQWHITVHGSCQVQLIPSCSAAVALSEYDRPPRRADGARPGDTAPLIVGARVYLCASRCRALNGAWQWLFSCPPFLRLRETACQGSTSVLCSCKREGMNTAWSARSQPPLAGRSIFEQRAPSAPICGIGSNEDCRSSIERDDSVYLRHILDAISSSLFTQDLQNSFTASSHLAATVEPVLPSSWGSGRA